MERPINVRLLTVILTAWLVAAVTGCSDGSRDGSASPTTAPEATDQPEVPAATTLPPSSVTVPSTAPPTVAPTGPTTTAVGNQEDPSEPPPVTVRGPGVSFTVELHGYCWQSGSSGFCGSGPPPPPSELPTVEAAEELVVEFPIAGWTFEATTEPIGVECGRRQTEPLEPLSDTTFRLVPQGKAGDYQVTLFGRGHQGDVGGAFRWRTSVDGVVPVPDAHVTVVHDRGEGPRWLNAEVILADLRVTPSDSSADVTITGADGTTRTAEALPTDDTCIGGEGWLQLREPEPPPYRGAGSGPYDIVVDLVLDGQRYVGTARWPDDVDPECDPCIRLDVDPPLPALTTDTGEEDVDVTEDRPRP